MVFTTKFYRKAGWLTCFSIFLLVLAGGIVRSTGSGMGCPDWPTCFGTYIPPTHDSQLPENYEDIFLQKRLNKIEKYVKVLKSLGFEEQANRIANDPDIRKADKFSVTTTWIEAINRYLGALTGLFALITFLSSFQFIKTHLNVLIITGFGIIAVLINGWMGSVVVATNLMQGPITIHYLAAFIAVGLFMWPVVSIESPKKSIAKIPSRMILLLFVIIIIQSITGTWSRETVDILHKQDNLINTSGHLNWSAMGSLFIVHRYLSIIVLACAYYIFKKVDHSDLRKWLRIFLIIMIIQILAGSANILFVLPPISQALHIFAGGLLFGISMYLSFKILKKKSIGV